MSMKMENKFNFNLQETKDIATKKALSSLNARTQKYSVLLKELIETIYKIQSSGQLEKEYLDKLEEGIMTSWEYVFYYNSGFYLANLSHYFEEPEELLIKLSHHKDYKIRLRMVIILKARPSERVLKEILPNCINDKSKDVRLMVADVILGGNYKEFLFLLEDRLMVEPLLKVKNTFEIIISLLKKGYYVHKFENGKYVVQVKYDRGVVGTPMIEEKDLEKYTSKEYIEEIKNKHSIHLSNGLE